MNNQSHNIVGLILAGGEGRRLGGRDKGLQKHKGKPLIEYVIIALEQQTDKIILSANRNLEIYKQYDLELVSDNKLDGYQDSEQDSYQGPLAGIIAALPFIQQAQKEYLLLASCDTPNLPIDYASKLHEQLKNTSASAAVVHDGNRTQNLHCLIRCDALASLQAFYQQGGRALYRWFKQNAVIEVDFSRHAERFLNINTLEQLQQ